MPSNSAIAEVEDFGNVPPESFYSKYIFSVRLYCGNEFDVDGIGITETQAQLDAFGKLDPEVQDDISSWSVQKVSKD